MSNVKYAIIHGQLQINRKEINGFQKGDAIWGEDAAVEICSRYNDIEVARKELTKYECSYNNQGLRGLSVKEYALVAYRIDEDGIYFFKNNYELASEKSPSCGGSVHVYEKYVLDGDYKTIEQINMAIRNKTHILEDYFDDWSNWQNYVEWRDGKTIILEEFWLN